MLPTLFVSHGSPMVLVQDCAARRFLVEFGTTLPRPRAIAVVTAHWDTRVPAVGAAPSPSTIYDFGGFPDELYRQRYTAPGEPELAGRIGDMLSEAGLQSRIDPQRGYDHGIWIPLKLMYPDADIPVVPISVQSFYGPAHHFELGRALAALREEDVLVMGSGSFTHDLRRIFRGSVDAPESPDVAAFSDWMDKALIEGATQDLLAYRTHAPFAVENHPTEEHLLPLFAVMGAAGPGAKARRVHASSTYGVLRMDAYAFG
jgi:4,5-DOPA dioxygenase extradiol